MKKSNLFQGVPMTGRPAKELLREILDRLAPDATVDEVMEALHLASKIERGVSQAEEGETLSHEEARQRLLSRREPGP